MRTRKFNKKNGAKKPTKSVVKPKNIKDTEPTWSLQGKCVTFTTSNANKWWSILQERYYNCIDPKQNDVKWFDKMDGEGLYLFHTLIHVTTTLQMAVTITIHHTTNKLMVQGKAIDQWVASEYPGLKKIFLECNDIEEDIHKGCKEIFKDDTNFAVWDDPNLRPNDAGEEGNEDEYPKVKSEDIVKMILDDLIYEAIAPLEK